MVVKIFQVHTKNDKLDTGTLPDSADPLSRVIPFSCIGSQMPTYAKCNSKHQAKGDHKDYICCLHQHKSFLIEIEWQRMV